jgi:hypothetical protein
VFAALGTRGAQFNDPFVKKEAFMHSIPEGQCVRHFQYGLGVVTQSDPDRTSIDFHLHGLKKFDTKIMVVELSDEAPPPKLVPSRRRKKAVTAQPQP